MILEMLQEIFNLCIIPLLGIFAKYFIDFLNAKREEAKIKTDNEVAKKYIDMITNTVNKCVIATNQTYVNSLKESNAFNKEAQEVAFEKTMTAVLATLSDDAKDYIVSVSGDLRIYLTQYIEAEVNKNRT